MLSVLDIFRIGIGPSSSHTVGPMRIGARYVRRLRKLNLLQNVTRVEVILRGSLAFTGEGHASPRASIFGLMGYSPASFDPQKAELALAKVYDENDLFLGGKHHITFNPETELVIDYETPTDLHPNEMVLQCYDKAGSVLISEHIIQRAAALLPLVSSFQNPSKKTLSKRRISHLIPLGQRQNYWPVARLIRRRFRKLFMPMKMRNGHALRRMRR
jgi:L-serine dehydratase